VEGGERWCDRCKKGKYRIVQAGRNVGVAVSTKEHARIFLIERLVFPAAGAALMDAPPRDGLWASAPHYDHLSRGIPPSYEPPLRWGNNSGGGDGGDYFPDQGRYPQRFDPLSDHMDPSSSSSQYNSYYYDQTPAGHYQPAPPLSSNYYSSKSDGGGYSSSSLPFSSHSHQPSSTSSSSAAEIMLNARNSHETRHARRLYVGGIPAGQTSEEHLRSYLNEVISRCLGEDNNNSYTVSIYMNHKKCFAFVELKSIELTNACLDLDGILYCSSVLRIQRANEYKPELVAAMPPLKTIKFNLSKAPFLENSINGGGVSAASLATGVGVGLTGLPSIPSNSANSSNNKQRVHEPEPLPMGLLRPCSIADVSPGCIALVGFPYDEGARRSHLAAGSASAPGVLRFYLTKLLQSNLNTEFSIDLSNINILDVGDVPFGLSLEDALSRLNDAIVELIKRGAVPVVIGGSQDQSYPIAGGLMDVVGGNIGVVNINSRLSVNQLVSPFSPSSP
jgi:hypothetical protein